MKPFRVDPLHIVHHQSLLHSHHHIIHPHPTPTTDTLPTTYLEALSRESSVGLLLSAMDSLDPQEVAAPLSLLSRLVLTNYGGAQFLNQFVQVRGWGAV